MKYVGLLIIAMLGFAAFACEGAASPATSAVDVTPAATPLLTTNSNLTADLTATSSLTQPDALSVIRAAGENLRALSSFHIEQEVYRDGSRHDRIKADINPPDRGMMREDRWVYHPWSRENLYVDGVSYFRPIGFYAWFKRSISPEYEWMQEFPFDLAGLQTAVGNVEWRGTEVVNGVITHRLTGDHSKKLEAMLGFYDDIDWWKGGALKVEIWISRDDLLPLRIELRSNGRILFSAGYSGFDTAVKIHPPKETLLRAYYDRMWDGVPAGDPRGGLREKDVALLMPLFPDEGKECVEAELGTDLYEEALSGSDANAVVSLAIKRCLSEVLSASTSFAYYSLDDTLYMLDLSSLSISPEEMVKRTVECLRKWVGLESLFEIGYGEREPTLDELEAAAWCKP